MLSENIQENTDSNVEFLFERPIGWSSACLDSTINYYLHCEDQGLYIEGETTIEKNRS